MRVVNGEVGAVEEGVFGLPGLLGDAEGQRSTELSEDHVGHRRNGGALVVPSSNSCCVIAWPEHVTEVSKLHPQNAASGISVFR